ncbi:MAG: L,D-transpeptidase family protein [Gammaproteobacteria bacterium]|jgi:L,D-transpeptidase ErfK/SrfK|nr:L,D-transpeptidase family protein [Gammaproteobacteria bacterium]MDP7271138.1 L,D-transpeptidase family protein [Gammaproteobacteria bacterium]HJP03974.1 L,D-transpeptidase family protein [Gammaproteobacteria bacterium]
MRSAPLPVFLLGIFLAGCSILQEFEPDSHARRDSGTPPIVSDRFLLESPDQHIVGQVQAIRARYEDTFVDIARAYNLGFDELVEANPGIDPWLPGKGTRIILPTRFILPGEIRQGIVINLASKRLFFYLEPNKEGLRTVVTYPIGIGRSGWATPTGETHVASRGRDPAWYVPVSVRKEHAEMGDPLPAVVPPGPENPLGSHVLTLEMPSYLIHGTNRPAGVGMRVSHGCIRLFPEDIEFLYTEAPDGIAVTILDEPRLLAWQDGILFLEAHPPLEDDERDWLLRFPEMLSAALSDPLGSGAQPDPYLVDQIVGAATGIPMSIMPGAPDFVRIKNSAKLVNNLAVVPELEVETESLAFETGN